MVSDFLATAHVGVVPAVADLQEQLDRPARGDRATYMGADSRGRLAGRGPQGGRADRGEDSQQGKGLRGGGRLGGGDQRPGEGVQSAKPGPRPTRQARRSGRTPRTRRPPGHPADARPGGPRSAPPAKVSSTATGAKRLATSGSLGSSASMSCRISQGPRREQGPWPSGA